MWSDVCNKVWLHQFSGLSVTVPGLLICLQVCASLGLCPASPKRMTTKQHSLQTVRRPQHRRLMAAQDKQGQHGMHAASVSDANAAAHMTGFAAAMAGSADGKDGDNMVCAFCQAAVQYARIALESNATIDQIAEAVGQLCDTLGFGGPAVVDCDKVSTLPLITITMGGRWVPRNA